MLLCLHVGVHLVLWFCVVDLLRVFVLATGRGVLFVLINCPLGFVGFRRRYAFVVRYVEVGLICMCCLWGVWD